MDKKSQTETALSKYDKALISNLVEGFIIGIIVGMIVGKILL